MTGEEYSSGPLDVSTLEVIAQRAVTHPLADRWAFHPDTISPRRLELSLGENQYPSPIAEARLDVRWFEDGDHTVHYVETRDNDVWQCRWDRHPKPGESKAHFHPPPDAASDVEPSTLEATHHLGVLFGVLDWITERIKQLHDD
ncbi:hypothetical protein BRD02_08815 [Halobacteriales archaeon QS_8_69_73]|nr:MAG: hypothetical protein BRD02_08815 [Halobacteriales archaeon QS_8_69_73]